MTLGICLISGGIQISNPIAEAHVIDEPIERADRVGKFIQFRPSYVRGDCESLGRLFSYYGATKEELSFFIGQEILRRESGCGLDTYNERTGDTGVCQLTHLHSKPGYFFGKYYEQGWAVELFGLYVGSRYEGAQRDDPNIIPACLWLLRGGSFSPGKLNTDPWNASLF